MNLSPAWVPFLAARGWEAQHWSDIGPGNAPDNDILKWARENNFVVVTQDLDFSQLLFATRDSGPSVVLLRLSDEFGEAAREFVVSAIAEARETLADGALLTVGDTRVRLRRLPLV
jgi:predicted nuclease of predicted toxin-antitoxin system